MTNNYHSLKKYRWIFPMMLFLITMTLGTPHLMGQTIPVGMPFFEDALRRGQLMRKLSPDVSFTIRPVDPLRAFATDNPFGADTLLFPLDTNIYSQWSDLRFRYNFSFDSGWSLEKHTPGNKSNLRLSLLPIYTHTRFNSHHPYGWADGAMVPAKGLQQYISGGIYLRAGWFEAQLRPEFVWAQNSEFQNPPFRQRYIDMPERMGQERYEKAFLGQSFAKLHIGHAAIGFSNENIWWGPGRKNAIIMSNNAPGFRHFTLHTNRPLQTRYGTFEGQVVAGKLRRSGFTYPLRYTPGTWPPIAGNVEPDTINGDGFFSYITGMVGVYQPKWTPGLFLGLIRVVQAEGEPENWTDYFEMLYLASRGEKTGQGAEPEGMQRDQRIAFFARYLFPESHAEIYMEIGREDNWWDFEDFVTRIQYSTTYLAGFRRIYDLKGKDQWLEIMGEYTKIQSPFANLVRPTTLGYSFYTHGAVGGWTHRGQVMGAGIGPGSNMMTVGATYGNGFNTFGLHIERTVYNEDLFYTGIDYLRLGDGTNPFFVDASKHFVDWGFLVSHHTSFNKLMAGALLHLKRTYNFQWNYDPHGGLGPFRFSGLNKWSVNAELSLLYRF